MSTDHRQTLRQLLAQRIRILRILRGWSQEQLAEVSGLHRTYIGAVERAERNITIDNIEKIALAFEVPVSGLFGAGDLLQWANGTGHHRVEEARPAYYPAVKYPFPFAYRWKWGLPWPASPDPGSGLYRPYH